MLALFLITALPAPAGDSRIAIRARGTLDVENGGVVKDERS
jgi:hypothetical protein